MTKKSNLQDLKANGAARLADAKREEQNRKARERRAAKKAAKEAKTKVAEDIVEAKRQSTAIPVHIGAEDDGGSHTIDHLTILDNHEVPDTNQFPSEDLADKATADLSFWNNSWCWIKSATSYGDKPEDEWFVNPTPELIGKVMQNAPTIFSACEVALIAGNHMEQLKAERERHLDFLRGAYEGDLVSESLDMMKSYQNRYIETVQRYLGLENSYTNQLSNPRATQEQLESAQLRKEAAGAQCRTWAAKLISLVEAYHACVSDERAFNLSYNFAPLPPEDGKPPSREYGLFKWTVSTALGQIGRRLARSIKEGKMDAEKYRIPRPWLDQAHKERQVEASAMISDFN